MIQITPQMRILLAVEPVDFRKGIDGLVALCRQKLRQEPLNGAVFVFSSRKRTALKILVYDAQGFWLCQKRLSQGRFQWWPRDSAQAAHPLDAHELQLLLWNGDPASAKRQPHCGGAWPPRRKKHGVVVGAAAFGAVRSVYWLVQGTTPSPHWFAGLPDPLSDPAVGCGAGIGQSTVTAGGPRDFGGLATALSPSGLLAGDLH
jgi:transposase